MAVRAYLTWALGFLAVFDLTRSDFGGHDLFTSLAQLEVLWHNERDIVQQMKDMSTETDTNVTKAVNKYLKEHQRLGLDQTPNYDFLGHPINAYLFIRHVAHGWSFIRDSLENVDLEKEQDLAFLKEREKIKLPNLNDIDGAAFGIVRLHSLYKFNLTRFVEEGVIDTVLDNGQVVVSQPSVLRLTSYDLARMGAEASENGLYDSACDMLEAASRLADAEEKAKEDFSWSYVKVPDAKTLKAVTKTAKKVHDQTLDKRGMKGRSHRTHQYPYDEKLRKKKKFKKGFKLSNPILTRNVLEHYIKQSDMNESMKATLNFVSEVQMDELCRGKQLRPSEDLGKLYCTYVHGNSDWLKLGPIKMEINSFDPFHVVLRNLLFDHECDEITRFLGPLLDFPPGRMNHKSKKNDWTMKNCWPQEDQNIILEKLNRRIEHISGFKADSSKGYSEGFMCGNYGIGGFYFIHPDFHHHGNPEHYIPGTRGNRVSTILTVLESPEAGGATVWPNAGISVFPEKGSAVWWYNLRTSDYPDYFTRHAACPVLLGQKWIGNKWVGYNAQWNGRKCDLNALERFDGPYT